MKAILYSLLFAVFFTSNICSKEVAQIGKTVITQNDVDRLRGKESLITPLALKKSDQYFLDKLMFLEFGLLESKKSGLHKTNEAREIMNGALFNYYLYKKVDSKIINKTYKIRELKRFYRKNPYYSFKRLCLPFNPQKTKTALKVHSILAMLRSEIKSKKINFREALDKHGNNPVIHLNGIFEGVSSQSLDPKELSFLKKMKKKELSPIIIRDNFVELIQLVKKHPFSRINTKQIENELRMHETKTKRDALYKKLKKKYKKITRLY